MGHFHLFNADIGNQILYSNGMLVNLFFYFCSNTACESHKNQVKAVELVIIVTAQRISNRNIQIFAVIQDIVVLTNPFCSSFHDMSSIF